MRARAGMVAAGLVIVIVIVAFLALSAFHLHDLDSERCWHGEGPSRWGPYFPGEDGSRVDGEVTWLPLGHQCLYWNEAHTDALVIQHPDWPVTLLTVGGAGLFVGGVVSAIRLDRRRG